MNGEPVEVVTELTLLGTILQRNSAWDAHFHYIFQKARRDQSVGRKVWLDGFEPNSLWTSFHAFVTSHIFCAGYPAFCDLSQKFLRQFLLLGTTLCRWTTSKPASSMHSKFEKICIKFIKKVEMTSGHPLMEFFASRTSKHDLRKRKAFCLSNPQTKHFI